MANDELVGNLATENLLLFLDEQGATNHLDRNEFEKSLRLSGAVFTDASATS